MKTSARTTPVAPADPGKAMSPDEFMKQITRRLRARAGSASEVVAFYDRHGGPSMLERLSYAQRLQLAEIMHWADTVVEHQTGSAPPTTDSREQSAPVSVR